MAKRGKCPSLITGNHGRPKFQIAAKKRTCKRCRSDIPKDDRCVFIPHPGTFGGRTYCCSCLQEIIEQSRNDLNELARDLSGD